MVVVVRLNDEYPLFGVIKSIILIERNQLEVLFIFGELRTLHFDAHYHAYVVSKSSLLSLIHQDNLISPLSTHCRTGLNGKTYVTLRHAL